MEGLLETDIENFTKIKITEKEHTELGKLLYDRECLLKESELYMEWGEDCEDDTYARTKAMERLLEAEQLYEAYINGLQKIITFV